MKKWLSLLRSRQWKTIKAAEKHRVKVKGGGQECPPHTRRLLPSLALRYCQLCVPHGPSLRKVRAPGGRWHSVLLALSRAADSRNVAGSRAGRAFCLEPRCAASGNPAQSHPVVAGIAGVRTGGNPVWCGDGRDVAGDFVDVGRGVFVREFLPPQEPGQPAEPAHWDAAGRGQRSFRHGGIF